jgi:hypothetical protein
VWICACDLRAWAATRYAAGLAPTQHNNRTHDVGFMIYYSYGLGYQAGPDSLRASYGPIIFNTALSLAEVCLLSVWTFAPARCLNQHHHAAAFQLQGGLH